MTLYHNHHLIEFNNGERLRTNKIIKISLKEHGEAHKQLYLKYNHWKDYVAWKALTGQLTTEEINKIKFREAGKRTSALYNTGRIHTKETREKIRQARLGKKRSLESCLKQSKTKSVKEYTITTPEGKKIEITNLKQWSINNGLYPGSMWNVIAGRIKHHKGYKVSYKYN